MTHHNICDECETVAHCSNHGCIPKVPAPVQEPVAWVDLLKQAEEVVRSKSLWKKYIDGTPLANDIAVWMASFAQEHTTPPAAQPAPVQEPSGFFRHEDVCGDEVGPPTPYYLTPPTAQPAPVQKGAIGAEYQKSPWDGKGISMPPPAAQRQWVGLTPDEYRQLEKETTVNGYNGDYCPAWDLIEAVEAKLKEKNT
jgi:hypothetical protein